MTCILCDGKKLRILSHWLRNSETIKVEKCQTCGLVQLNPIPESDQIKKAYNTERISIPRKNIKDIKIKEELSKRDTVYNSKLVKSIISRKAKILDYGCGYGFFVKEMLEEGFNISGMDISDIRLATARAFCKNAIFFTNEEEIPHNYFDCLTLFHVLEHTPNPLIFLGSIKQYVKKGGKIIIEVPNLDDHLLKISNEYKDFYWKKEHIFYFNKKTLTKYVNLAGLSVVKVVYFQRWNITNYINWLIRKEPQDIEEILVSEREKNIKWLDGFYKRYLEKNEVSDALIFICQK